MPRDLAQIEAIVRRVAARLAIANAVLITITLPAIITLAACKSLPSIIARIAQ